MYKFILTFLTIFLVSCGDKGNEPNLNMRDPAGIILPGLSENSGTDISLYALNVLSIQEAEIILPENSPTTLEQVGQTAIFTLFKEPYSGAVSEGNIDNALVITLKVLNIPNRTRIPFEIQGISVNDIDTMVLNGASVPVSLAGYFDLGAQGAVGFANLVLIFKADQTTEGTETMTLRLQSSLMNASLSINAQINDTSTTPPPPLIPDPTYTLTRIPDGSVSEGNVASPITITLTTTGVASGTSIPYSITGISAFDIETMVINGNPVSPSLTGNFVVNSQGISTMVLIFRADQTTEGSETMILGLPTVPTTPTTSVTINDTSMTPPIVIDTVAPLIALTSLNNFIENVSVTVFGIAADNVGISSVNFINRINGVIVSQGTATLTSYGTNVSWIAVVGLGTGNNNIEFTAVDPSGRSATEIIVLSGGYVTGQTSYEEPEENMVAEISPEDIVNPEAALDEPRMVRTSGPGNPMEDIRRQYQARELGKNSDKIIDLASLNIPQPPAEVHPCNQGTYIHLHEYGQDPKTFESYNGWWLLVATGTNSAPYSPDKVHFFWARNISEMGLGGYDTKISIDNQDLRLGSTDAKLNIGWAVVPYVFARHVGTAYLPVSRNEICEV